MCWVIKNNIKNVDLKSAPRWSKVRGGGLGSFGKVPKLVRFFLCSFPTTFCFRECFSCVLEISSCIVHFRFHGRNRRPYWTSSSSTSASSSAWTEHLHLVTSKLMTPSFWTSDMTGLSSWCSEVTERQSWDPPLFVTRHLRSLCPDQWRWLSNTAQLTSGYTSGNCCCQYFDCFGVRTQHPCSVECSSWSTDIPMWASFGSRCRAP